MTLRRMCIHIWRWQPITLCLIQSGETLLDVTEKGTAASSLVLALVPLLRHMGGTPAELRNIPVWRWCYGARAWKPAKSVSSCLIALYLLHLSYYYLLYLSYCYYLLYWFHLISHNDGLLRTVLFYVVYLLFCGCFLSTRPGTTDAN